MELLVPIVMKSWRRIAIALPVALIALYGALLYYPPVYEVSASVMLKLGREMNAPATASGTQIVSGKRPEDVSSEIEIMRSQHLLERVVSEFGEQYFLGEDEPKTLLQRVKYLVRQAGKKAKDVVQTAMLAMGIGLRVTPKEMVVAALAQSITLDPVKRSDVINVTLTTPSPEQGIEVLNKYLELYLRQHVEVYRNAQAKPFFQSETLALHDQLADASKQRQAFREARKVWELGEQRQLLLKRRAELAAAGEKTTSDLRFVDGEIAKLMESKGAMPAQVELSRVSERNPVLKSIDDSLLQLESSKEQALSKFLPESRNVLDLTGQISKLKATRAQAEQYIVNSVTSARNEALSVVDRALVEKRALREGLLGQAAELSSQRLLVDENLRALDQNEIDLDRWNRSVAILNKNYLLYTEKMEEARISEAMDLARISNVTLVAPATAAPVPVWPPRRKWLMVTLALGLLGPLIFALGSEMLQPTVRSRYEAAAIAGAPVLGCIPENRRRTHRPPNAGPPGSLDLAS